MFEEHQVFLITPRQVVVVLSAILILFVLANITGNLIDTVAYDPNLFRYTKKLYLDREDQYPNVLCILVVINFCGSFWLYCQDETIITFPL